MRIADGNSRNRIDASITAIGVSSPIDQRFPDRLSRVLLQLVEFLHSRRRVAVVHRHGIVVKHAFTN